MRMSVSTSSVPGGSSTAAVQQRQGLPCSCWAGRQDREISAAREVLPTASECAVLEQQSGVLSRAAGLQQGPELSGRPGPKLLCSSSWDPPTPYGPAGGL